MSKAWKMYLVDHMSISEIAKELSMTKKSLKLIGLK